MPFERAFHVSWSHLDSNGHMANTAYLDIVVDVRFMYFAQCGFPPEMFHSERIGPVVRRDEVDYYRELRLLQPFTVDLALAGLSADASRFRLRNEIRRADGELAARITSLGGMFDLAARRLVAPPPVLADALRGLDRTGDFQELESSVKRG
ncbi:MAG TPA: acyl-CoA thioesterase [Usitatibacter sp.]|nr:acyl-CoA thioesterase [Usitatibacter sp.]